MCQVFSCLSVFRVTAVKAFPYHNSVSSLPATHQTRLNLLEFTILTILGDLRKSWSSGSKYFPRNFKTCVDLINLCSFEFRSSHCIVLCVDTQINIYVLCVFSLNSSLKCFKLESSTGSPVQRIGNLIFIIRPYSIKPVFSRWTSYLVNFSMNCVCYVPTQFHSLIYGPWQQQMKGFCSIICTHKI